ncbi:DUF559 domain-containing protein [Pseudomonas sp. 21LCFQ010]|uniref:endonuclease domain-containing protein n=1 Tax=Pseudomonas sp. 21LCFQ010 TaxID=2957506 RepID=UPI002096BE7C|nr:DUF559 domain-containing protein [Pseudomonas sp. 21LCFQ010]MCO8164976.1 DUF559 domain-containing protein [Pseudomonas sp. 21LCFQ010]
MTHQDWLKKHEAAFGGQFEQLFAHSVLPLVPGIDFSTINVQFPFKDSNGKPRFCDFVIEEDGDVRIAIEVDGYDKRGTGSGMSHAEFVDWQRRQSSLTSQGWFVLRFANRDVRDQPGRCAEHIGLLLKRQRAKARDETLNAEENRRLETLAAAQKSEIDTLARETSIMKYSITSLTVLVGVFMLAFFFKDSGSEAGAVAVSQAAPALGSPSGATCDSPLDWRAASDNIGQVAAITGPVIRVTQKDNVKGQPTWIEVGAAYPNSSRLVLIVWGPDREAFGSQLSSTLEGKVVCAIGMLERYKGVSQIELKHASQLQQR